MAEWQTHKTQNLAGATSCGFKSHHPHQSRIPRGFGMKSFGIFYIEWITGFERKIACFYRESASLRASLGD